MILEQSKQPIEGPVLALDTSTASMAAAVVNGQEVLGEVQSLAERNHSVHVVKHMKQLLASCGVTEKSLAAIAVGKGPGSYTGMRIAVSAAKTLAWAWNKPLVGVSSLEAIAYGAFRTGNGAETPKEAAGEQWVLPLMDARRGQVYSASFGAAADGGWRRIAPDAVRLMNHWVDELAETVSAKGQAVGAVRKLWLAGDLTQHEAEIERLSKLGDSGGFEVVRMSYVLEGRWIANLGQRELADGKAENPHTFTPNYTQLTEAEVKLKAKQAEEGAK